MKNNYILCFIVLVFFGNLSFFFCLFFPNEYYLYYDLELNFILGFLIPLMFLLYCFLKMEFIKEHFFEIFIVFGEVIKKIIKFY
jgi:hypothetical protein